MELEELNIYMQEVNIYRWLTVYKIQLKIGYRIKCKSPNYKTLGET